jgi:adenylate kinase family enzyme
MLYGWATNAAHSIRYHFPREAHMALLRYDPQGHIDSDDWLTLDESERMELVRRYHRRKRIRLPNETIHAVVHVIVENQMALGDEFPAKVVLLRLMKEGLDRHEAIHAIGSVLSEELFGIMSKQKTGSDLNAEYVTKPKALTAESWRKQTSSSSFAEP